MASNPSGRRPDLTESSMTIPSDSENYSSGNNGTSPSPPSSSSSPVILYSPPTIWGLLRGAAINLLLPFVNGLMLGFGELFAHEAAFRLGWSGTKVGAASSCEQSNKEFSVWNNPYHCCGSFPTMNIYCCFSSELTSLRYYIGFSKWTKYKTDRAWRGDTGGFNKEKRRG